MGEKRNWTIHFFDGEVLTICADWVEQPDTSLFSKGSGFFDFTDKIPESEETTLVASVQCGAVKYISVEAKGE